MAKLWAIREGGFQIGIQLDYKHELILSIGILYLIHDCRSLLKRPWVIKTSHIRREANGCADLLAKKGEDQIEREI
ncbi:hypothetical protein SO802_017031 [Lithocarpus litseifolius]|uniref:RNase H type-1 domain-containing protein n=1 Tax=Lithocarpus litseifolius TaxID=425828 RepID=A0AAW2D2B5_9ROSI